MFQIEQLHSSDNLGTVLRNLVAEVDDKSPANGQGSYVDLDPGTIIKIAQILRKLNANSVTMTTENHGTNKASSASLEVVSGETPGRTQAGGERAQKATADGRNLTLSKQDSLYLMKKIRDFEQKCKPLQEKNKKFLEKNMELTTLNRDLKEQIRTISDENRKLKENLDQARRKCSVLARQLNEEKLEKGSLEIQVEEIGKLRAEISEQAKTITNLKHASAEKDRRMEVLQHRKKRRLRMSAEHLSRLSSPCSIEEEPSHDSDLSLSSMSVGTLSDDDLLEELPHDDVEKIEKNYKKLMKEQLTLQKSTAQLQNILGWRTDSQRYVKSKLDFETDLYIAQCKIENLEECLSKYKEYDSSWVFEKDQLIQEKEVLTSENQSQIKQIAKLKEDLRETTQTYEELKEQTEHLEFLVLETQENKIEPVHTVDASTETEDEHVLGFYQVEEQASELVSLCCKEAALRVKLEMSEALQDEYRATINGLEEKLAKLLQGQGSEVATVMQQLKQAEQHVIDAIEVEKSMHELEGKVSLQQQQLSGLSEKLEKCEKENSGLVKKLAQYRGKLDSQEQSLALTRDEREELLQVKPKQQGSVLNNRLKLAEMGLGALRQRSLEREGSRERNNSPLIESPTSPGSVSNNRLSLSGTGKTANQSEKQKTLETENGKETDVHFEQLEANMEYIEPVNYDNLETKRPRINSMPMISTGRSGIFSEVDKLQRQIQDLQDENDVLKFELMQKGHGDSDSSGSDSEDSRVAELRETCENLRERLQSAEATERQCKDRLKLAEKHITELELAETVLRDRVEEGNIDCDKLRKQIVRLQRKIRELKEISSDKDANEQALLEKVKYLEDAEAQLSQKVTELEGTNQLLRQRLDVRDELTADVQLVETLTVQVKTLQTENNLLESKMIDLEENNELLRDNWKKVADEEANRRDCMEDKIRLLEAANNDLKAKLKEKDDMEESSGPSIATEIHDDTVKQLNKKIQELESELEKMRLDKDEKIVSLENLLHKSETDRNELKETVSKLEDAENDLRKEISKLKEENDESSNKAILEKSENVDALSELKASHDNLVENLASMEKNEENLKEKISEMEKVHEKKIATLKHEIAEYQQQEDDLCTRIEELEENEAKLNEKISKFNETEMNFKNKIEELENRETSLTIGFSQRVEELERHEREVTEKLQSKIQDLEDHEAELSKENEKLSNENLELIEKINTLEKHEKELSEKSERAVREISPPDQENVELVHVDSDHDVASLEVHDKYKSCVKLESEASISVPVQSKNQNPEQLQIDNQNLTEEISKLKAVIQEAEKEQKALEDRLKRQEKKRKRSERADNVDDYDTIAREVVTYKLEVEQLRTENTDLHERLMELDESEKCLLEKNEQLKADIEQIKNDKESSDNGNDELNILQKRVLELEGIERSLKEKLEQGTSVNDESDNGAVRELVKQQSSDSAYESSRDVLKETADKSIGTGDFMEGVMGGQDQGRRVSSMFERTQFLETENQELATRLSSLTATDTQVRQLSAKIKSLEENEDSLMERVMELEEEEDRLTRELNKLKKSTSSVDELEEELSALQENEQELNSTIESLKGENDALKKTMQSSYSEKGDIAIRLAAVQKMYDDEKKKVESLLKGEERWMKSVSSEKKAVKEMEEELANTQEKLEELQTEYENKLSEKDEREKVLKDEINKVCRDKEMWKKKLQEYEKSNSELEDEIEACKISESRMFHRHQQLITQNEELELKLSKLVKLLPNSEANSVDIVSKKSEQILMAENPEVVIETPLTQSIFNESELELLRGKTPDTELLGSVPLDMLRKIQDFDKREQEYQVKIQDIEAKNSKLVKKVKVLLGKEKDLKHENKELQLELLKKQNRNSSLRASTSSLDMDRSGSEEGLDLEGLDGAEDEEIFDTEKKPESQYDEMTHEELLLSVKLQDEKLHQDTRKTAEFEGWMKDVLEQIKSLVTLESMEIFVQNVESLKLTVDSQHQSQIVQQMVIEVLDSVTSLKQRMEALQSSEEKLRISLAENELSTDKLHRQSSEKIEQLEAQIHVMAKLSQKYQVHSPENQVEIGIQSCLEERPLWDHLEGPNNRFTSPVRQFHLETSKTINIDVPPSERVPTIQCLGYSETVNVNVPPSARVQAEDDRYLDRYSGYDYTDSPMMMDKAEDVLRQRIRELEKLEKHLKQQVSDLEADREELHGIARTDKNLIHELNVRLRELQLSQRNLQEQIKRFETSENSLYARLDELEGEMDNKDDRIRDLEILEQRLKDLVKQYKLDEKILQTKSQSLESSVKEMSEKEETLKQKVQNLETEKSAFSERSEYLQTRLKELEGAETDLAHRAKNQDNIMQTLQNTVIELETFGANAHARVVELEHINFDLQQRLHHSMTENSPLSKRTSTLQQHCDSMENELSALRDKEVQLQQENDALQKNEISLQQELKNLRMNEVALEAKVRDLEECDSVLKDKLSKLQRSENTLKYRVQELETSGIQAPSDLNSSQSSNMKLPRTLEECQRRIIVLQSNNAELQSRLQQQDMDISGTSPQEVKMGSRGMVSLPQAEYQTLQRKLKVMEQTENQLEQSDLLNTHLQDTVAQLREGKDVCGHEVEIEVLRNRLDQANKSVKILQSPRTGQWIGQGPNVAQPGSGRSPQREEFINDLVGHLDGGEVEETLTKTTANGAQLSRPPGQKLSRDHMIEDLLQSLQSPSPTGMEDDHWREIETRMEASGRGGEQWISVGKATSLYAADPTAINRNRTHGKNEELELGLALQSETESHISQNDTDSGRYGDRISPHLQRHTQAPPLPQLDSGGGSEEFQMILRHIGQTRTVPSVTGSVADSGRGTASMSIATSGMTLRERIAYIERQLSARESDSAREMNGEMDLTSWKTRVHDSNRRLEIAEKENKHFKDEINKLEKELEEKTRIYLILEAFLKSVRVIIADKNGENEKELIIKLETEVEKVTSNMEDGGHRPDDISHDPAALNTELAKKDRELNAKRNEVDSLMRELRQWQQECRSIEDMRSNALDSLRGLEVEISELQVADKQLKDLKDDYNTLKGQFIKLVDAYKNLEHVRQKFEDLTKERDDFDIEVTGLKSKVALLEGQLEVMEASNKEKVDLEEKVIELKGQLSEYEKVEIEKSSLEKNLAAITDLLNERMRKVESLTEEVFELRKKTSTMDRDNYKLRQQSLSPRNIQIPPLPNNVIKHRASLFIDMDTCLVIWALSFIIFSFFICTVLGMTEDGKKVQTAPLRARIVQLTNLCNEKDILIKKLVQELKRLKSGDRSSPLVEELCRLENKSDHNHNVLGRSSSQSSLDSIDRMSVVSDTELIREHNPRHAPRPRSADIHNQQRNTSHRHSYHGSTNLPRFSRNHQSSSPFYRGSGMKNSRFNMGMHSPHPPTHGHGNLHGNDSGDEMFRTTQYVAIADYDPSMFSQSGHPRLELSLKEGDIVLVNGPLLDNGYVEGEVKGRVGLVPISYLEPSSPHRSARNQRKAPGHLNASPEVIAQLYSSLHGAHQSDMHGLTNGFPSHQLPGNQRHMPVATATGPPAAPENFHVEKIIGNSSLMLAWEPVPLDNTGTSNGVKVTGYKIYKNNKVIVQPRGRQASKAIIENISIQSHHRFGVQTVGADGHVSELSEIMYEGVEEVASDENSDTESEMDMATVLNVDDYKNGPRRMFMGIYDYDPTKNSPYDHPSCELAFNAGDIITVYGRQRGDGFYYGEINGVRGLVPTFFIEEMPQPPPRTKKMARSKQNNKENKTETR
ncbi:centrosomal protein of 290 kDa-like [Ruditapes philippinarum]|uniref:centrosomal protein of 290 kDa-like n=1 Tax=Ruditapes philippinarum TaxID=129788 RepID=UPI00295B65A3|nr:centrosomal protein of 290 kDa-like [Ruditapes philippinarum]